ncbi:phosphoribosylanthranilate isomerase [Biformimicrobium ophioploci]|uniref:N-(5'-phosphoribosyl)anthranilate isomerase n=1 Tax=Biformimicrobium ophioploci TaxID=3036711 RepID=A0ABQ6LZE2_9GAMM|nr:phosphoribosylanthranilate isomerase [Microbulbifer sp. NKW57]GMG87464.1 phosphoribosylanthranilate isomerase [Microbulbifer sp. NKW57]
MATRVKICGITSANDAQQAQAAGADALGLVFYPDSPRYIDPLAALEVAEAVGPFVTLVGLFVDATEAEVNRIVERVPLNLLQFHGNEPPEFCASFSRPYIRALRMREGLNLGAAMSAHQHARGFLLDAYVPGIPGGTGARFDWSRVPQIAPKPLVLAGGLSPENVAEAISIARPWAVDVSGGVEVSPGVKDAEKMASFVRAVRDTRLAAAGPVDK